jgi:predicted membrane protein
LVVAGLLGASVVAIVQLSSVSSYDLPLLVAGFAFAISVPTLTIVLLMLEADLKTGKRAETWYDMPLFLSGLVSAGVGFGAVFWHLHWAAGVILSAFTIAGIAFVIAYDEALAKAK